jgi:hypothetical protein
VLLAFGVEEDEEAVKDMGRIVGACQGTVTPN